MRTFFSSLSSLESYTHALQALPKEDQCQHCLENSHWVSHGYIYKQHTSRKVRTIGKRILCSARYGRQGCGHTRGLYVAAYIPGRQYTLRAVIAFIGLLIRGFAVEDAYRHATRKPEQDARHAWRWLNSLEKQLSRFRVAMGAVIDRTASTIIPRNRRLRILLPTFALLRQQHRNKLTIQAIYQCRFF